MFAQRTPHRALLACLFAAAATGYNYGFGIYSKALKAQFNMSQQQLDNINTIPYAFGILSPLCGMLMKRLGPRLTLLIAGSGMGCLQLLTFFVANKTVHVSDPPTTLVAIAVSNYFMMALVTAAAFATPVMHFQKRRGCTSLLLLCCSRATIIPVNMPAMG